MVNSPMPMDFLVKMPDGTLKQMNPFTGTQVWTVPGRGKRPLHHSRSSAPKKIQPRQPEDYCFFCPANYTAVPPEKARIVKDEKGYRTLHALSAEELFETTAEFRRVPNMFEIITFDYWEKNYNFQLREAYEDRKRTYVSTPEGREHLLGIINQKLKRSGKSWREIKAIPFEEKLEMANSFFAGGHELIIARHHYEEDAVYETQKAGSASLSPEAHYQYIRFTTDALLDIYINNRYIRYVTVFQNWLKEAGASFDHLHKQLVGIDGRSVSSEREFEFIRANPNAYNSYAANYAGYQNLIFAENEHALAFADFGHRFPTLAVYSKSRANQPWNHSPEEIRGVSDLVHACHAAMGSEVPCNEEWYYRPPDVDVSVPWHILIKWRISTPAGFEAVTKIFVNAITPWSLRDRVVENLFELRENGKIAPMKLATECDCMPNALKYNPSVSAEPLITPQKILPQSRKATMTL